MAFDSTPTTLFSGYSSDGTNITIPIASILGLSTAAADDSTGDWRAILLGLCATAFDYYNSLPVEDRPVTFRATPPTQISVQTGNLTGTFKQTYSLEFYTTFVAQNISDEPAP